MLVIVVSQGAIVSSTSDAKSLLPHPVGLVLGELRTPKLGARPTIINVPPTAPHQINKIDENCAIRYYVRGITYNVKL